MKIWIDLTNSPHINFFKPFVNYWKKENFEVIITARDLGNTIDLIKQNGWDYTEVGGHAGRNTLRKLFYFPKRVFMLKHFLKEIKPNIGISHSSFYSPVVGRVSGFPTIYLNDNEHAKGNYIAFKFASLNLIPEFLNNYVMKMKWDNKFKIEYYSGIKEGIYLSQLKLNELVNKVDKQNNQIFVRLEPRNAQYYKGQNDFIDDLILQLKGKYSVTILPRDVVQAKHYITSKFQGITVVNKPLTLEEIVSKCNLFIGAGGSMTREMAFLGVPTISIYQGDLLEVDKYLIKHKYMFYTVNPTLQDVEQILKLNNNSSKKSLLQKGNQAFNLINKKILEYAKN